MSPACRIAWLVLALGAAGCASAPDVPPPAPDHGELVLAVQPGSAEVYLDGVRVGEASDFDGAAGALALEPGRHVVMVRKPGFATYRGAVRSRAGQREVLQVVLVRIGE